VSAAFAAAERVSAPEPELCPAAATAPARWRRMDPYARLAYTAAARLERPASPERTAVVLVSTLGCYAANLAHRSALAAGEPSPHKFTATLPSIPVGEIAAGLAAHGPQLALAHGLTAPLDGFAWALRQLTLERADAVLVVACEVIPDELRAVYPDAPPDGAQAALVTLGGAGVRLLAAASAFGPGASARCRTAACARAGCAPARVLVDPFTAARGEPCVVIADDVLGGATALVLS
jgi:hypothetical protein